MTLPAQRTELGHLMDVLAAHEPKVHYAEIRPMRTHWIGSLHLLNQALVSPAGITMDCSESVTLLCQLAGLHDPNGVGYDGTGYTGTLLHNLPHYTKASNAKVGALIVFGPGSGEHVCMVRERGSDPLLFSHGSERGPIYIRLSEERRYHRPPVTFLSIAKL